MPGVGQRRHANRTLQSTQRLRHTVHRMLQHKHRIRCCRQFRRRASAFTTPLMMIITRSQIASTSGNMWDEKQNRGLRCKALDQISDFNYLRRVEAYGRLIQNQQPRPVQYGLRQPHALPKTFAQLCNGLRQALSQSG
ncbi:uncharacterized ABC transporter ATP-binding protein YdbJ, partial [Anaerolineaceae bacterium]